MPSSLLLVSLPERKKNIEKYNQNTPERVRCHKRGEGAWTRSISGDVERKKDLHRDERYGKQCQAILGHANFRQFESC